MTVGLPLAGGALGWVLLPALRWLVDQPWLPGWGPLELVTRLPEPASTIVVVVVGVVGGLAVVGGVWDERVRLVVSRREVSVQSGDVVRTFPRDQVGAVFLDGEQLVLLDTASRELLRCPCDLLRRRVEAAFTGHRYPWTAGDPHERDYRHWVDGDPDLPPDVDRLLAARARTVEQKDGKGADDLRARVASAGFVVRDRDGRQQWRPVLDGDRQS